MLVGEPPRVMGRVAGDPDFGWDEIFGHGRWRTNAPRARLAPAVAARFIGPGGVRVASPPAGSAGGRSRSGGVVRSAGRDPFEARKAREPVRKADHARRHRPPEVAGQRLELAIELVEREVRRTGLLAAAERSSR